MSIRISGAEKPFFVQRVVDVKNDPQWGLFSKLISKCEAFADIDPQSGIHGIIANTCNPHCKVYSFDFNTSPLLRMNLQSDACLNGVDVIRGRSGESENPMIPEPAFGKNYAESRNQPSSPSTAERELTIDDLCQGRFLRSFDMVRVASAGNTRELLKSLHRSLHDDGPVIWMDQGKTDQRHELAEVLSFYGYRMYSAVNGKVYREENELHGMAHSEVSLYLKSTSSSQVSSFVRSLACAKRTHSSNAGIRENGLLVGKSVHYRQ